MVLPTLDNTHVTCSKLAVLGVEMWWCWFLGVFNDRDKLPYCGCCGARAEFRCIIGPKILRVHATSY